MKNAFFALAIGIVLFLVGCKTVEQSVENSQTNPQELERKKPELWFSDTYPGISSSDPVTFYNEFEINIEAKITRQITMFKDGDTYVIDSSIIVQLTVPPLTPAIFKDAKRDGKMLKMITVSFDPDENYSFNFVVLPNKSFTLDANKKITFEGKTYAVKATIKGKGDGLNHLLSNFYFLEAQEKVSGSAGGQNAIGTKIIK